jgi:hypothetical protein
MRVWHVQQTRQSAQHCSEGILKGKNFAEQLLDNRYNLFSFGLINHRLHSTECLSSLLQYKYFTEAGEVCSRRNNR